MSPAWIALLCKMRMAASRTTKVVVEPTTEEGGDADAAFCRSPSQPRGIHSEAP